MGILKTAAKVAVASSVHGRIQRRQQQRWAAQDQAAAAGAPPGPAPQAPVAAPGPQAPVAAPGPQAPVAAPEPQAPAAPSQPSDMGERLTQLKQLGELLSAGVLTQAEFEQQKARILSG
jgi:Short C-terminal domain